MKGGREHPPHETVHLVWLAQVRPPLGQSIEQVIDTNLDTLPLQTSAAGQLQLGEAARHELRERVRNRLASDSGALASAGWFGPDWIVRVLDEAARRFDEAFNRWRELYREATRQFQGATLALSRARKRRTRTTRIEGCWRRYASETCSCKSIRIGKRGTSIPIRYLASEGFLPGYNFPALPVRAWVPRNDREFISRPRFLALRELAPENILYHVGAKWEVSSFQSRPGGLDDRRSQKQLCRTCGAFCDHTLAL
jgi:hypothetical protein